jgi:hypothetical protein
MYFTIAIRSHLSFNIIWIILTHLKVMIGQVLKIWQINIHINLAGSKFIYFMAYY